MEDYIRKFIPASKFKTHILKFHVDNVDNDDSSYRATLRAHIHTKDEFRVWLTEHERQSSCTYRVLKTIPRDGERVVYKVCC